MAVKTKIAYRKNFFSEKIKITNTAKTKLGFMPLKVIRERLWIKPIIDIKIMSIKKVIFSFMELIF
jgi:hypothetical protein